jgi:hypothetical protein
LAAAAIATGLVVMFAWLLLTQPLRTRPIEIRELAWPALVLIITLVGLLLRRRANRESKPPS